MTLNFFTATRAHQAWKQRLYDCVCGTCSDLDPGAIASDDRCDLGKWLHSIALDRLTLRPDTRDLFSRLVEQHARFHRTAAAVAQQALADQRAEALQQLRGGDYTRVSNQVIGSLGELYLRRGEFGME